MAPCHEVEAASCRFSLSQALPEQPNDIDGFREWLHMTLDGPGNHNWIDLVASRFGRGVEATDKLFELFD